MVELAYFAWDAMKRFAGKLRPSRPEPPPKLRPFGPQSAITEHLKIIERLRKKFDPFKAAQNDAVRGDPNLKQGQQGQFEYNAVIGFQSEVVEQREEAEGQIKIIDYNLKHNLPDVGALDEGMKIASVKAAQDSALNEAYPRLVDSKHDVLLSKRGLNAFRLANPPVQDRPVLYRNPFIAFVGVIGVWAFELAMNYNMLLNTHLSSGADIFIFVFMTATINLLLGLLGVGFVGARNLGHVKTRRKLLGATSACLSMAVILFLHFVLAHYRNALDLVIGDADAQSRLMEAIQTSLGTTMTAHPLVFLGNLKAITVFLMGLGFAAIAAFEGYYLLADPYPGYQAKDHIYQEALDFFDRKKKLLDESLAAVISEAKTGLDNILLQGQKRFAAVKTYVDQAADVTRRYDVNASAIEHAMLRIIDEYRAAYCKIRENDGPPQWQEEVPRLNPEPFELDSLIEIEEREKANLIDLDNRVERLKLKLTICHTEMLLKWTPGLRQPVHPHLAVR